MKRSFFAFIILFTLSFSVQAQGFKGILKGITQKDSSGRSVLDKVTTNKAVLGLSNDQIAAGLKQALEIGAKNGTGKLSVTDGFFRDAAVKILMPAEAKKVEATLRTLGFGRLVDSAVLSMNRAAEDAAKSAAPVFLSAIKGITIQDALGILKGGDFAATNYLKTKTTDSLSQVFRPVIEKSVAKANVTKYWTAVFTKYNLISRQKVNTDLTSYITEKTLSGVFTKVGEEEQKIRKDPVARTTDLLKQVFGAK
jgi:hypothetical protein